MTVGKAQAPGVNGAITDDYDLLPYPSLPHAQTQPARIAAVAALHGLRAADAARARVLELGCAAGGNIIPLAERFPNARFLGVDLARRHVEQAQQRICDLGLANIEVRQGDLTHFQLEATAFDYIICHGVFSWAPPAAQDGILRICRDNLSSSGIAFISYNVLPGWRLRSVIRDICLRHTSSCASPAARVAQARAIIGALAETANENNPYGLLLRKEAQRMAHRPASYILGEFLVKHNEPAFFTDFATRAASYDLSYLDDAELEAAAPEILNSEAQARLASVAGADPLAMEQFIDELSGRTLRCSLLVRSEANINRARDFAELHKLHLSGNLEAMQEASTGEFKDVRGRKIKTAHPAVQCALARLAKAYPETRTIEQLMLNAGDVQSVQNVIEAMSLLISAGQIEIATLPLRVGQANDVCPRVRSGARAEAAADQPWITNFAHKPVQLKPAMLVLMPYLTGENDRGRLIKVMSTALADGSIAVPELQTNAAAAGEENTARVASLYVERTIQHLARNGLLDTRAA